MGELISTSLVLSLGFGVLLLLGRQFSRRERSLLALSFGAHVLSSFAQVWITRGYYGYGDLLTYHGRAQMLVELMQFDFSRFAPEVLGIILHQQPDLPVRVIGAGAATGAMTGITAFCSLFLNGSLYAICLFLTLGSFVGKVALYLAFRDRLESRLRFRAMLGALLVPSAVFWTAGILKETVAMAGLGLLVLGTFRSFGARRWRFLALAVVGALLVGVVKSYILFAHILAAGVWVYWRGALRQTRGAAVRIRPFYLALGAAVSLGGVILLGQLFPDLAVDRVLDSTAALQEIGARVEGGSNITVVEEAEAPRTIAGQLAYAPLALVNALFRPFVTDVRNPLMAVNALETTSVLVLFAFALYRHRWTELRQRLLRSSELMYSATFTLVFGFAVGLASTNLGSLSRYRAPLMPFFVMLILLWTASHSYQTTRARNIHPAQGGSAA